MCKLYCIFILVVLHRVWWWLLFLRATAFSSDISSPGLYCKSKIILSAVLPGGAVHSLCP